MKFDHLCVSQFKLQHFFARWFADDSRKQASAWLHLVLVGHLLAVDCEGQESSAGVNEAAHYKPRGGPLTLALLAQTCVPLLKVSS